MATIIFVMAIVNILYYFGIMQRVVAFFAKIMYKIMNVSGAEALSNIASAFVGQVEAQIMIRPYLATATKSELLASMSRLNELVLQGCNGNLHRYGRSR